MKQRLNRGKRITLGADRQIWEFRSLLVTRYKRKGWRRNIGNLAQKKLMRGNKVIAGQIKTLGKLGWLE